jgi:hypothetical protein
MSIGKPLDFEVPWFSKYSNFEDADMIILGASTGIGKSTLTANLLKEFKNQNITPYLISTEKGARLKKTASKLGLVEGDFYFKITPDPLDIEFEENSVTILDWLKPKDYAKTDQMFSNLNERLIEKGGLLIVFMQLRDSGEFRAKDMVSHYASLVATYNYKEIKNGEGKVVGYDRQNTYWQIEKIRDDDGKPGVYKPQIPMKYNRETKLVELVQ